MTEKELQTLYTAIINKDVKKAHEITENCYLSKHQILNYLKNYVQQKSTLEQEEYKSKYEFFLASYYPYFKIVMSLFEELDITGTIDFSKYPSLGEINQNLLRFKHKFPEYTKTIDKIQRFVEKEKTKKSNIRKIDNFLNPRYERKSYYEDEFYILATSENPLTVLKNYNWTEKQFYDKLYLFKKKYPKGEDDGLTEKFENWFKQYLKLYKQEKLEQEFEERNDDFIVAQSIVKDLIASGKSIYEYCHLNLEFTYSEIQKNILLFFGEYKSEMPKSKKFITKIESRENKDFIKELNAIADDIIDDENYTIIDYYLSTKLDINDFLKKVEIRHPKISEFVSKNFDNAYTLGKQSWQRKLKEFNKQQEFKVTRIIKERLITKEEKEAIFKYLEENQIPINTYTYRAALNKLVNNDLDFNKKVNIYKIDSN